jgi:hypothetical protein
MTAPQSRSWQPKLLDAGGFQQEISSFRLHLAAEGKAARTVRTEVPQIFRTGDPIGFSPERTGEIVEGEILHSGI